MKLAAQHVASGNGVDALATLIRQLPKTATLAIDTETGASRAAIDAFGDKANFVPYAGSYITGISLCPVVTPGEPQERLTGYYVPVGHERDNAPQGAVDGLLRALSETLATHEFHHGVFDWPFLANLGPFVPSRRTIDTQVWSWLKDENVKRGLKRLGEVLVNEDAGAEKAYLKSIMESQWDDQTHAYRAVRAAYPEIPVPKAREMARRMRAKREWGQLTPNELAPYAARDATLTYEVGEALEIEHRPGPAFEREMEYQHVLYAMTRKGVSVDPDALRACDTVYAERAEKIRVGLEADFGLKNPSSSQQVIPVLFGRLGLPIMLRTKTGAPSTDKNALEMLQGDPTAARILEYRKWKHAQGQALGYLKHSTLSIDGRIHGHYRSDATVTGRLSSSGPNVMNIPREDTNAEIRAAFYDTGDPSIVRYGFDLASAELWVTASITNDPVLTETLLGGENLHVKMMQQVFGGEADKSRREYTLSKNVNFGIEYGAGEDQITIFAAKAGYSPTEARKVAKIARDGHQRLFAKQHAVAKYLSDYARKHGKIPLCTPGRYRHFDTPGMRHRYYSALNALVQGGVGELMKDVMIEIHRRGYGELLVLQVHDELVFDGPEGMDEELLKLLADITHDVNPFKHAMTWAPKRWAHE